MKIALSNLTATLTFALTFVLLSGCSTPQYKSTKTALFAAGKTIPPDQTSLYTAREQEILALQKNCDDSQKTFADAANNLTGQATFLGVSDVGISWAGLASGIAATALTVASPANAVWTVVTAGFAGASSGFALSLHQQGFSKAAIAQSMAPILQIDAYAYTNFTTAKLIDLAVKNADTDTWAQEMAIQSQYVSIIKIATIQLESPYVPPANPSGPLTPSLTADFTANPPTGAHPLLVNFTDHSSTGATLWFWSFGDGHTGNTQNPSNAYSAAGTYTVTLVVSGNSGAPSSKSKTITVN